MSSIDSFSNLFPYLNDYLRKCEQILSLIGLYFVGKISIKLLYKLINNTYIHIWSQLRPIKLKEVNKWAIITNANNGMGFAFAEQLAQKRINLIIIDKNEGNLQLMANQISNQYNVNVIKISAHFNEDIAVYDMIGEQISDKEIIVLVNNVSLFYEMPNNYLDLKKENILSIMNSSVGSVLMMTYLVLPQMVSRKYGFIINISSLSALKPIPQLSTYSASAAFIDHFSRGLSYEYKSKGIIIQSLMPSFIYSPFNRLSLKLSKIPIFVPSYKTYAKFAINTMGFTNRTTGYLPHEFQYFLFSQFPEQFWTLISRYSLPLLTLCCI